MGHTLGTAAKATGMSRTAILRAINKGKISANKNDHGEWDIDPAELHRLYPQKQSDAVMDNSNLATRGNTNLIIENKEMKAKLEAAEQRVRDNETVIDDLRHRLDRESEERRQAQAQLTALLTDQRPKPQRWVLPAVIGVAVLVVLLLLIAFGHPVRSALVP
jgi:hypothetical protein